MSGLEISLLGTLQLSRDGTPLTQPVYAKALALLSYLAVESDRPHPRASIAALLWPDLPDDRARHNLRQALSVLRRTVGQDGTTPCLHQQRDILRFVPNGTTTVDVQVFQRLLAERDAHPHADVHRCASCRQRLDDALVLYRDEFLHGFSVPDSDTFEDWAMAWRQRLQDQALGALEDSAAAATETGDHDAAVAATRRELLINPLRESAWRRLMTLLWRAGDRAAALNAYERCRQVLDEELGVEPEAETIALSMAIRDGTSPSEAPPVTAHTPALVRIPATTTRLVGRQQEAREIMDLLGQPECRLLTLTGPGGSGKTRLAIHLASEWASQETGGMTCFVSLEAVHDASGVAMAIADELGLGPRGAESTESQLLAWLRDREGLLVLDSAEHLLDHLTLVPELLSTAPGLTILVTSRERLHIAGEWIYAVGGLRFPHDAYGDAFEGYDAVDLLSERLRQARGGLSLHHEERPDIVRICHLVDGMPLGIELAAAWAHTLTVAEIADSIRQNLDFLQAPRGQPDHHLSMRAVFNSSWEMLTASEQTAYKRLSVFRDGFDAQAAATVTGATIQSLAALMSKSLLTRHPSGRYRLHPLLAQFGEELHQQEPDDHTAIHDVHSRYYLHLLDHQERLLRGADQPTALTAIEDDLGNIRAAWAWGIDHGMLPELARASFPLWLFFVIRGWMHEGDATFGAMLNAMESGKLRPDEPDGDASFTLAMARIYTGGFRSGLGQYEDAVTLLEAGLSTLREHVDRRALGLGLNMLSATLLLRGETSVAREHLEASLAAFREVGDVWGKAFTLNDLGMVLYRHFHEDTGEQLCEESRETFRSLGDRRGQAFAATSLALIAAERGEHTRALRLHREALALRDDIDDRWGTAMSHMHLGHILAISGDRSRARDHLIRALRISWNMSITPIVLETLAAIAANDLLPHDMTDREQVVAAIAGHPAAPETISDRGQRPETERLPIDQHDAITTVNALARKLTTSEVT